MTTTFLSTTTISNAKFRLQQPLCQGPKAKAARKGAHQHPPPRALLIRPRPATPATKANGAATAQVRTNTAQRPPCHLRMQNPKPHAATGEFQRSITRGGHLLSPAIMRPSSARTLTHRGGLSLLRAHTNPRNTIHMPLRPPPSPAYILRRRPGALRPILFESIPARPPRPINSRVRPATTSADIRGNASGPSGETPCRSKILSSIPPSPTGPQSIPPPLT